MYSTHSWMLWMSQIKQRHSNCFCLCCTKTIFLTIINDSVFMTSVFSVFSFNECRNMVIWSLTQQSWWNYVGIFSSLLPEVYDMWDFLTSVPTPSTFYKYDFRTTSPIPMSKAGFARQNLMSFVDWWVLITNLAIASSRNILFPSFFLYPSFRLLFSLHSHFK